MNFIGQAVHNIDHKGRVFVPVKFRKLLLPEDNLTFILTRGLENYLLLFPFTIWEKYAGKLASLPYSNKDVRDKLRLITRSAEELTIDSQGRVMLPKNLIEYGGIEKDVMFIGMLDKIELWNPKIYEEFEKTSGEFTEGFEILGI